MSNGLVFLGLMVLLLVGASGCSTTGNLGRGEKLYTGADLHIENIKIDPSKLDINDREQVEDLLLVAINRALEAAKAQAALETNNMLGGMMPGGMDQFLKP